jgi:hypothetical protein
MPAAIQMRCVSLSPTQWPHNREFVLLRLALSLTASLPYSVIEEFVEGFFEGFLTRNITLTPRLSKHDREPDSHYLTSRMVKDSRADKNCGCWLVTESVDFAHL